MRLSLKVILFLPFFVTLWSLQASEKETFIGDNEPEPMARVIKVFGQGHQLLSKEEKVELQAGDSFGERTVLTTGPESYLRLFLQDNSIVHVGANTGVIIKKEKEDYKISLEKGLVRVLSYKNKKLVKTPWGETTLEKGDFAWHVYNNENKLKVEVISYSGSLALDSGEIFKPKTYSPKPENNAAKALYFDKPYVLWFGEPSPSHSYNIAFNPSFNERKLASVEDVIEVAIESEPLEDLSFKKLKGEIWVHDVIYDEAVRAIEAVAIDKARELVPPAVREAAKNLVWEVASRSVIKWGTFYAERMSHQQVPLSVRGSYEAKDEDQVDYYEKGVIRRATEQVAHIRTYRVAKNAVLKQGYEKGWREAGKYAEALIPKAVVPVVAQEIYKEAKPAGEKAVKAIIKSSDLIHTKDVDRLIEHLSQVAAEKFTKRVLNEVMRPIVIRSAKVAAKEASFSSSEMIAEVISNNKSLKAGELIVKLMSRKRARKVARDIASLSKESEARERKRDSRRLYFESQR